VARRTAETAGDLRSHRLRGRHGDGAAEDPAGAGESWYKQRMAIIECVPNISEGRRPEVVEACVAALRGVEGVRLLDRSSDASHNRTVLTLAGEAPALRRAVLTLVGAAVETIDLRAHQGAHPRMGAVDVVPFVPIEGMDMAGCVALARESAAEVADRFALPVYLYEAAATSPARRQLEDIRRGGFEGLEAKMRDPAWAPDFGPSRPHPSAGAAAFGARMPLIAFNVNLATDRVEVAEQIARAVRHSSGGLRYVKALAVPLGERGQAGQVQVSMNLTDYTRTPLFRVFDLVRREAARYGVAVAGSEIVGLLPQAALVATAEYFLQLERFDPQQVIEARLRSETRNPEPRT
jgi:glutamate formiminotransferase / 5-formyltetrahydrofolate cyclo-ligase